MTTAVGIECDVDPHLFNNMKVHCGKIEKERVDNTLSLKIK